MTNRRYRKHGEQRRTKRLYIRVSPEEYQTINEQAEAAGKSVGAYLVDLAIPPEADTKVRTSG